MFKRFFDFLSSSNSNNQANNTSNQTKQAPALLQVSPLAEVEQALKLHQKETLEHQILSNLKTLCQQVEQTIENGGKFFGKGVFKLFDFVKDSLPEKEITQLRYYNRRSFQVFDKYVQLREVNKELNDHMRQLILGISSKDYAPLKDLILKGAEKGFDDSMAKYKQCKNIENNYQDGVEKVADFFDLIYEKFEKEIDAFFDQREGDVTEASSFYKLKTKFLDRKLKGLQQLVVKQNFEIANAKTFYKQEVTMLQSEIGDIKKDFSQTLIDVKSSIINCGFPGEDDAQSIPDVEYTNNSVDDINLQQQIEEEKFSTISKTSFLNINTTNLQNQNFTNQSQYGGMNGSSDIHSNQLTQRSRNSTHKYDQDSSYRKNKSTISKNSDLNYDTGSNYYMDSRRKELTSSSNLTIESKKPPLRTTYTFNHNYYQQQQQQQQPAQQQVVNQHNTNGAATTASGTNRDSHNQSQELNSSRQSKNSRGSRHANRQCNSAMYNNNYGQTYQTTKNINPNDSQSSNNLVGGAFRRHRGSGQTNNPNNNSNLSNGNSSQNNSNIFYSRRSTQKSTRATDRQNMSKQDSLKKIIPPSTVQIQQTVSDEDFSNILGGATYSKTQTVEVMSECSQQEEETIKTLTSQLNNQDVKVTSDNQKQRSTFHNIFSMPNPLPDNNDLRIPFKSFVDISNNQNTSIHGNNNFDKSIEERTSSMKRVQSSGILPQLNSHNLTMTEVALDASGKVTTTKHAKKISKFSLTFCNTSPVDSRDCSRERSSTLLSQMMHQQSLQINNKEASV